MLGCVDLMLLGRRAVVTGGSRGIGKAVARELVAEGARVVIVGRDEATLGASAAEVGADLWIKCDTGIDEEVQRMAAKAAALLGGVDILVNSAASPGGQTTPPKLAAITDDVFWPDVNVKVMGYLRCIRELAPHMATGSRIVNVSGLAARSTGSTVGSMRNVAVAAMTKNLADEFGPRGIAVVCVHPGLVRTEKTSDVMRWRADSLGITEEEAERRFSQANLIGRLVEAAEVAAAITFLASPRAVAINGDAIALGGGIPGAIHY
jgi:NAD(P)-dependent dehydrogenase (short-subunit alcohol dehydrogenase family)